MTTALITGASAGLGVEFARQLAGAGHDVFLVARREDRLAEVSEDIQREFGVSARTLALDLAEPDAPQRLIAEVESQVVEVGYLINNAGAAGPDLLEEADWAAHRAYFDLMVTSCVALCHGLLPGMRKRGFGRIVNVSSVAGRIARSGDLSYGPAKAYLVAFSESLNATLKTENVHTSALCPGFTHTDFHLEPDLAAMKAATPSWIWYDAATVVRDGLKAVERGKPVMVSGRLYRWADPLLQSVWFRPLFRGISR